MRKHMIMIGAAVVLAAGGCSAGAAAAMPGPAARPRPSCVTVDFGWRTSTGHQADAPVQMCGAGLRHDLICALNEPFGPGAAAQCYRPPRP